MKLNTLKQKATEKIQTLKEQFEHSGSVNTDIDLSRTAYPIPLGTRHPISIVKEEISNIFKRLGFSIAEGPEIEDDWHVFSSLNFAEDHPARDMQDTFFIQHDPQIVLRTHTSSVQTRVMERRNHPFASSVPVVSTGTRQSLTGHTVFFIRWKLCTSIRMYRLPI